MTTVVANEILFSGGVYEHFAVPLRVKFKIFAIEETSCRIILSFFGRHVTCLA